MAQYKSLVFSVTSLFILLIIFCEFIVYYLVLFQCYWPELDEKRREDSIRNDDEELKAILLADTHLLGTRKGHWFDKLRREWQMYRTFQTAISLHRPDVIFILGDLFDEGLWCSDAEFNAYVDRFYSLFFVPTGTKLYVVVGNHDIGFHYGISPYLQKRFTDAFNAPSVRMVTIKGNHFVLVNSMAMEGDGCFLCRPAEKQIGNIAKKLKCAKGSEPCPKNMELKHYSRPILLQHFPLYRESDEGCNEIDEAPEDEKRHKFRERWECLSRESSYMLLETLNPRLVVTGHTHHGCRRYHDGFDTHEFTLPSFSWRNKDNPSFMMAVITPNNYSVEKCFMPKESTVIFFYCVGVISIFIYAALSYRKMCRRNRFFKMH